MGVGPQQAVLPQEYKGTNSFLMSPLKLEASCHCSERQLRSKSIGDHNGKELSGTRPQLHIAHHEE